MQQRKKMPGRKKKGNEASKMEDELSTLSIDQLRKELKDAGVEAGPIDNSNK
jgi:hypothetical protein